MRFSPRFAPLRRTLAVWLALLIAVLGAIVPTLSHGLVRTGDVPLVEICTSLGPHWVALTDSPDSPDSPESVTNIEHCPFCLHATNHVVPASSAAFQGFDIPGKRTKPMVGQAFLFNDRTKIRPQPRGPPSFS